ncbi:MAG: hypothetical protein ACJ8G3_05335 [Burkholderiaceae bacterium]
MHALGGRAELYVGAPSAITILAEKFMPGLLTRYLARTGFKGQHTDEAIAPDRPSNLWRPVPGPYAARGAYSDRAHANSPQLWASMHRKWLLAGGLALGLLLRARAAGAQANSAHQGSRRLE